MRVLDIFTEEANLTDLKRKVKLAINATNDELLLNRIYAKLNSGDLTKRLTNNLETLADNEIKTYLDEIANVIIEAPGTFDEKMAFIDGLHTGYVDVPKLLDGKKHHFSDLLKPNKSISSKFLFNMFNEMKDLGQKAKKGPSEFSFAILSPKISVFGAGDLKIGGRIIEVKAGSGTIGDTSLFQHSKVHVILQEYLSGIIDTTKPVGAEHLSVALKKANLDPAQLEEFTNKLVDYIFKGQPWAKLDKLKAAIKNVSSGNQIDEIRRGYLSAAYSAYKRKKDVEENKWEGVLLINYDHQSLRYFEDPDEMYNDVDTVQFSFSHPNQGWGGKLISPSVSLKRDAIPQPNAPTKATNSSLKAYIGEMAEYMVKQAQQRWPRNLDLRDPALVDAVASTIQELSNSGMSFKKIPMEVKRQYPELSLRAPAEVDEPPPPARKGRTQTNPPAFTKPESEVPAPTTNDQTYLENLVIKKYALEKVDEDIFNNLRS
jgi:hypothetical protein